MDKLAVEYSGMNLGILVLWLLIATLAGFARARSCGGGRFSACGAMSAFGAARRLPDRHADEGFDLLADRLDRELRSRPAQRGDQLGRCRCLVAFIGALVLRGILRPITGRV